MSTATQIPSSSEAREKLLRVPSTSLLLQITHENHEIDWEKAKIMNKEINKRRQHVHEAKWIKHQGGHQLRQGELHAFSSSRSCDKKHQSH